MKNQLRLRVTSLQHTPFQQFLAAALITVESVLEKDKIKTKNI
jgi:hypothetical protein